MLFSHLLKDFLSVPAQADREISTLVLDSRQVQTNSLFLAIKGTQRDGRQYIADALSRGAAAVLVEVDTPSEGISFQQNVPIVPICQLQHKIGHLAASFYGHPARKLRMIGTTGTSGKTSCTHFIAQALQSLNVPCGIIGTLGSGFYGALGTVGLTTPDAITLQSLLSTFVHQGAKAIAMEVSSHSIAQGRITGIEFDLGIFTNLTQDHLDYHGDMESYAAVKRRFLAGLPTKQIIVNAGDAYGQKWINELAPSKSVIAYSLTKPCFSLPSGVPCIYAEQVELTLAGIRAHIHSPWGEGQIVLPLVGQFNLSNSLAVLTALGVLGVAFSDILNQLSRLHAVPGRMQPLGGQGRPLVVVDYAHKPDALEKVLQTLRELTYGKLICVFGCGGERDRGKRPLMAKIAERWADQVIVTNDNPRHEDPQAIAAEIRQGFSHPERVFIELDRSKAIENSIQWAQAVDCVLIAGKGAEQYQQIGDEKIPFDDVEKAKSLLSKWHLNGHEISTGPKRRS
jgi:UDP-N-acetylmuramoyl-L-alanyl-D-glutamate--2,6-diaminopimelate ligase